MARVLKVSAACGVAGAVVVFACILLAVASWSSFSWTDNALSDLGVQAGVTAPLFNGGLISGGVLFLAFTAGLFRFMGKNVVGKAATVLLAMACVMLIAVGVFNENFRPTHYLVSVGLFVFLPLSMLTFVAGFWVKRKRRLAGFAGLVAAAVWVLEFTVRYVPAVAVPEFVSGLTGAVWIVVLSYLMFTNGKTRFSFAVGLSLGKSGRNKP
jgi:hypothetical membrane protein